MTNTVVTRTSFAHADLPSLDKQSLRIGVAGNYGLTTADIHHAAARGVNFWFWTHRFKSVTPALKELLARDRERHVVMAGGFAYTAGMVRRGVEKSLKILGVDTLDLYLLGWLGRGSFFSEAIQDTLLDLKEQGKVKTIGTSIHDRERAGELAQDSILDAFMIRYNAKHPGAEQDIFPHLQTRDPLIVAYTATSWRQLMKPFGNLEMPPWPNRESDSPAPPPLSPALCYRFCLSSPHVHVVLTGPKNRAQLDQNLAALEQGPLSPEEEVWVREYGRQVKARKKIPYL